MQRVLIIEDTPDNMELITFILDASGFTTYRSRNGLDGLQQAIEHQPDFIILDVMLPDIDGYEVLKRLKSDSSLRDIPVIAMTSYAMIGDRERLLEGGCAGYIEKPLNPGRVVDQIRDSLGLRM